MRNSVIIIACVLGLLPIEAAWAEAGRFLVVVGNVQVVDANGRARQARRGQTIESGETVRTAGRSIAQLRMTDRGLLALRASTEFRLEQYQFRGNTDRKSAMKVSLLRGALRAISGFIGRLNRPAVRIRTPHATIGIRGTDHETTVLLKPQDGFDAGTFNQVFSGETLVRTARGTVSVLPQQAAFVSATELLPRVVRVPKFLREREPLPSTDGTANAIEKAGEGKLTKGDTTRSATDRAGAAKRKAAARGGKLSKGDTARTVSRRAGAAKRKREVEAREGKALLINPLRTPTRPLAPTDTGAASKRVSPNIGKSPTRISPTTTTDTRSTTLISPTTRPMTKSNTLISPTTSTDTRSTTPVSPTTSTGRKLLSPTISPSTSTGSKLLSPTIAPSTGTGTKVLSPTISPSTSTGSKLLSPTIAPITTTTTKSLSPTLVSPTTTSTTRTLSPTTTTKISP